MPFPHPLARLLLALCIAGCGVAVDAPFVQADFEGAGTGFALIPVAQPTTTADEVIAGKTSLRLDSSASDAEWHECLTSDAGLIPAGTTVEVRFAYRWLAKPDAKAPAGQNAFLYSLLRSAAAAGKDIGWTTRTWDDFSGKDGVVRRVLTTGPDAGYRLIVGVHRRAQVVIDDLTVRVLHPVVAAPPQEVGPPPGPRWVPVPELSDEFDGPTIDLAKWEAGNGGWKGREPAFFDPRNLSIQDGRLTLELKRADYAADPALAGLPKGYHTWTSASIRSRILRKYGFYEIRAKPVAATASSAFWFSHDGAEIDVFEIGGTAPAFAHTVHSTLHVFPAEWNGKVPHWARSSTWDLDARPVDDFHIYSLQWDEQAIVMRIDGGEVARFANTDWHREMPVIFDIETMPDWFGLPADGDALPGRFQIDWIRAWRAESP